MNKSHESPARDAFKVSADQRVIVPAFGLGRWAPFNWERLPHSTRIQLFWRRIAGWLVVLACVGWLLLATALYGFVRYERGFTNVSFKHMLLLPWMLEEYRRAKGEFSIKQGLELAEKQEWLKAYHLLRIGLLAVPENREGRLMTARICLMAGRPDMVRTLLIEGLAYHADRLDYLRETLGYFFGLQADETVMSLTSELRWRLAGDSLVHRMAVTALAYAYFNRDRFNDAVALLREERLLGTPEGRFVTARVAWERGWKEDALEQLRALTAQVPDDFDIYRTLVNYLNEERRWSEVRRVALEREFALPEMPEAYVDYIVACAAQGDEVAQKAAETGFLVKFADNVSSLLKLAESEARAGRIEVVKKVVARCRALGREVADAEMLLLLAHLERREYDEVLSATARLSAESAKWPEQQRLLMGGLKAAAFYGRGEEFEAEPWVSRLCDTRLLPAALLTALAEQWDKVGQGSAACRVLRHAVEVDPLHEPALVMLLRKAMEEKKLGDMLPLIERLLTMRKPPTDLLAGLSRGLHSDLYMFLPGRVHVQAEIGEWLAAAPAH